MKVQGPERGLNVTQGPLFRVEWGGVGVWGVREGPGWRGGLVNGTHMALRRPAESPCVSWRPLSDANDVNPGTASWSSRAACPAKRGYHSTKTDALPSR